MLVCWDMSSCGLECVCVPVGGVSGCGMRPMCTHACHLGRGVSGMPPGAEGHVLREQDGEAAP